MPVFHSNNHRVHNSFYANTDLDSRFFFLSISFENSVTYAKKVFNINAN